MLARMALFHVSYLFIQCSSHLSGQLGALCRCHKLHLSRRSKMAMSRIARSSLRQQLASNSRAGRVTGSCTSQPGMPQEVIPEIESSPSILTNFTTSSIGKHLIDIGAPGGFGFRTRSISMTPHCQYPSVDDSELEADSEKLPGLEPTKPGEKPMVVVLGTGWANCRFLMIFWAIMVMLIKLLIF